MVTGGVSGSNRSLLGTKSSCPMNRMKSKPVVVSQAALDSAMTPAFLGTFQVLYSLGVRFPLIWAGIFGTSAIGLLGVCCGFLRLDVFL
jgi:hypothetical protein